MQLVDDIARAVQACRDAHDELLQALDGLDNATARRPSLLPDWTVGHVLTHIARNADGYTRRMSAALRGEHVRRYPGGHEQRNGEIDAGHGRPAADLVADVREAQQRLDAVWDDCAAAGWTFDPDLPAGPDWPLTEAPWRRLREVVVHHTDLGLGYAPEHWPPFYVDWELAEMLRGLPERLDGDDGRRLLAALLGRGGWPSDVRLAQW